MNEAETRAEHLDPSLKAASRPVASRGWRVTECHYRCIGGTLLLLGIKPALVSLVFVVQMLFGIYLVHLRHGWFVVGHGLNGMEYSVTLIAALVATALTAPRELPGGAPIPRA